MLQNEVTLIVYSSSGLLQKSIIQSKILLAVTYLKVNDERLGELPTLTQFSLFENG